MKLFIIGNGFDVGHQMETSYAHFRNYLHAEDGSDSNSIVSILELMATIDLWKDFELALGKMDDSCIRDQFRSEVDKFNAEFDYDPLDNEHITRFLEDEYYGRLRKLNTYFEKWISTVPLGQRNAQFVHLFTQRSKFVNFNYTLMLEDVYNISKENVLHIHGSILDTPIIGHSRDVDDREYSEHNHMKNGVYDYLSDQLDNDLDGMYQSFYDNTTKNVDDYMYKLTAFVSEDLSSVDSIHVIGHSLSSVDLPYFVKLNQIFPDIQWTVSYHDCGEKDKHASTLQRIGVKNFNLIYL